MIGNLYRIFRAAFFLYATALVIATHMRKPPDVVAPVLVYDKVVHFAAYCVLAVLGWRAWPPQPEARLAYRFVHWIAGGVLFAAADEWLQPLTGRDASIGDWLADVAGWTFGLGLACTADRWMRGGDDQPAATGSDNSLPSSKASSE